MTASADTFAFSLQRDSFLVNKPQFAYGLLLGFWSFYLSWQFFLLELDGEIIKYQILNISQLRHIHRKYLPITSCLSQSKILARPMISHNHLHNNWGHNSKNFIKVLKCFWSYRMPLRNIHFKNCQTSNRLHKWFGIN